MPRSIWSLAALAALTCACNTITGAEGLGIDPDFGAGGDEAASADTATSTGPSGPTSSGAGGASTGSTSASTGSSGPSSSSSSSGTGSGGCSLPVGPYGEMPGNTVSPQLVFQGYADQSAQAGSVALADYFDCDGTKGINAILIDESATWCGPCQDEAGDLVQHEASWQAKGIRVLTLMVENASSQPATLQTASEWKQAFGLNTAVAADPNFSFYGSGPEVGLPLQLVVDPRTFKIIDRQEGFSGEYSVVENLAAQNSN